MKSSKVKMRFSHACCVACHGNCSLVQQKTRLPTLHKIATMAVAMAGVVVATSATARDNRTTNIPCPAMPPTSIVRESREGALGLQVVDIGISANRSRTRVEQDVIIQTRGTEAYLDIAAYTQACDAFVKQFPGNPTRQFQELMRFRSENRRAEAAAQLPLPLIDLTPAESPLQAQNVITPKTGASTTVLQEQFNQSLALVTLQAAITAASTSPVPLTERQPPVPLQPNAVRLGDVDQQPAQTSGTSGNCSLFNPPSQTWISTGTLTCGAPTSGFFQSSSTNVSGATSCVPQATMYIPANMVGNVFTPSLMVQSPGVMSCTTRF
jgi:hypothetical protein